MASRTAVPLLLKLAQKICSLIADFTPAINKAFGDETTFIAALSVMNAACAAFILEAVDVIVLGD